MTEKPPIYSAEIFFVRALFPYIAGIIFTWYLATSTWLYALILITVILFATLVFIQFFYHLFDIHNNRGVSGLIAAAFLFTSGALLSAWHQDHLQQSYFANAHYGLLKVKLIEDPQIRNGYIRCRVSVLKGYTNTLTPKAAYGDLMLYVSEPEKLQSIAYGTELIVPASYKEVDPPTNVGEFDYQFWLATQNIRHQLFTTQNNIVVLHTNSGNHLIKFALHIRNIQLKYYKAILKSREAIAFASTLILGYRSELDQEIIDIYSKTGTIHALSVSGMHVGIIYLIISWILQFLGRKPGLLIAQTLLIILLIWLYTLVTGFSPSVLRAAIMLSVFLVAKIFKRQSNHYNTLAFTAFCLLIYQPLYLWDIGFQLSFLAVLGLISIQPKLQYSLKTERSWVQKLWALTTMSLAAQIATFPLSIYYFHQFPVYFLISNLFIALPIAVLMYLGIAILIFRIDCLAPTFEQMIYLLNISLKWMAHLPLSTISGIWITKIQLIILSLTVILLSLAIFNRSKKMLFSGMFCLFIYCSLSTIKECSAGSQKKQIHFKLKHHQATAYIKGYSAVLITDLKPTDKVYKHSIQPTLELHCIRKIRIRSCDNLTE